MIRESAAVAVLDTAKLKNGVYGENSDFRIPYAMYPEGTADLQAYATAADLDNPKTPDARSARSVGVQGVQGVLGVLGAQECKNPRSAGVQ